MASSTQHQTSPSLPQYGFGDNIEFRRLFKGNPFLFRVYTPKERSPFADDTDPYFLAPKFNEAYSTSPTGLSPIDAPWKKAEPSYNDVIRHLDWTTRPTSAFISTSFSFVWSIWEGLRRYHSGFKHDIHIAIINAEEIAHHSFTAAEILGSAKSTERHINHWKWHQYCQESQTTLVYGAIPTTAIYASVPLASILERLPSYFLRTEAALISKTPALPLVDQYAWSSSSRKPSYKHFCRDRSDRFLQLPYEARLRDTTAGSVRLAIAFLSPWFHETVPNDFSHAVQVLTQLSLVISQWPGQWWSREHYAEISRVTEAISLILAEQTRDSLKAGVSKDDLVSWTLEDVLDAKISPKPMVVLDNPDSGEDRDDTDPFSLNGLGSPTAYETIPPLTAVLDLTPTTTRPVVETAIHIPCPTSDDALATPRPAAPDLGDSSRTPTTIHDLIRGMGREDEDNPTAYDSDSTHACGSETESVADTDVPMHRTLEDSYLSDSETACDDEESLHTHVKKSSEDFHPASLASLALELIEEDSESDSSSQSSEIVEVDSAPTPPIPNKPAVEVGAVEIATPASPESEPETPIHHRREGPSALETASYALTCFLIGSFITLCILSPHRRTLATHLT